jgi:hypothetical protein
VNSIVDELTLIDPQIIVERGTINSYKKDLLIAGDKIDVKFGYQNKTYGFLYENIYGAKVAHLYCYYKDICVMIKPKPIYEDFITDYVVNLFG